MRLMGRFASMPQRQVSAAIQRRGGIIVDQDPQWVILGEESTSDQRTSAEAAAKQSEAEQVAESELWRRMGLVEGGQGVHRLYTPAMLAELVGAPLAAIRRWERRGALRAISQLNRLSYFDFSEVRVAQRLTELLEAGRSLAAVDLIVDRLTAAYEQHVRPLAELPLVVEDGVLFVRDGESLRESTGQRRFDFDALPEELSEPAPAILAMTVEGESSAVEDDQRSVAVEMYDQGDLRGAIEAWRLAMLSTPVTADDHFMLAEWLYQSGKAAAARERYYAALELDEHYLEARVNLGCVLNEMGETELAAAAFQGALDTHEGFADAHFHLAQTLETLGEMSKATSHWRRFLEIAPDGPWADEALRRLESAK